MYTILSGVLNDSQIMILGSLVTFLITFFALRARFSFLPADHGREFAVNGGLSKGKLRGVGLVFVVTFLIGCLLFLPLSLEFIIYGVLLFLIMLSGYLDDASDIPWNEYKKGAIDLAISIAAMLTFLHWNPSAFTFLSAEAAIPKAVYIILGIILIWVSINVTNCTDGVDGLCSSVCIICLLSYALIFKDRLGTNNMANAFLIAAIAAYLCFNTSPSSQLMGDAGSRALGFYLALLAMKSGHPFSFLLLCLVYIIDGGLGLVKVSLLRFLKISILKNTRTPIHDHVRLKLKWSDTQVVFRYMIIQAVFALVCAVLVL